MSSVEQPITAVPPIHPVFEGNGTPIPSSKGFLFRQGVLIAAMVLAMTGWVYALGWVAIKLI
jgi:hypothetical protein